MENLLEILNAGVSSYHCVANAKECLKKHGFEEIYYNKDWELKRGGRYMMQHHGTCLFAFTIGKDFKTGDMIRLAGAHTDYPCLRIKANPDFQTLSYAQINVEVYGGAILNTWLDRPLGISGRVALRSSDPFHPTMRLYRSPKPLMIIPNLAIHMNREVNSGTELNRQIDMMPIVEALPKEMRTTDYFITFLAEELGVDKADILDFELNTYVFEEPCYIGLHDSMLSAPFLDDQTSVAALLSAIEDGERENGINMIALYDNEEVGSRGKQGASSSLTPSMLRRIMRNLGLNTEEIEETFYDAMCLSVDVAHAVHPNKTGKADITNKPTMGNGFCIKEASIQTYATDAEAIAIVEQICDKNNIPYQKFLNRSDIKGGGTIGSILSSMIPIKTVDIGVPMLAMHSSRELMGVKDQESLTAAITAFFRE